MLGSIDKFFMQLTFALIAIGLAFVISASWHDSMFYFGNPWREFLNPGLALWADRSNPKYQNILGGALRG